jgi:uncharacterized protein (TIRG00374 family)
LSRHTKWIFTLLRIGLAAGLLFYLARSGFINWSSLTGLASAWHYTVLATLLFFIASIFQSWRLQILINAHQLNLPFFAAIRLTFIGLFFNTYMPGATGGDFVKIYYASKGNPGRRTEVITILLLDRFIGLFSLLTLPLLLAPLFPELIASYKVLQGLLVISLLITLVILVIAILGARYDLAKSRILNWIENKVAFGDRFKRMLHTLHYYRHNKSVLFQALLFSYFLQLLMTGVSLAIAEATNPAGADVNMVMLIPLGYLVNNALPLTPGGIGVGEAALESLFSLCGLQGGAEVLLGWRLIMVLVGLVGLAFYLKGEKRFVFSSVQGREAEEQT